MSDIRKNLKLRLTPAEFRQFRQAQLDAGDPDQQAILYQALQLWYTHQKDLSSNPNEKWHRMLDEILLHGDEDDVTGITQNLRWAVADIGSRPDGEKRRKAG